MSVFMIPDTLAGERVDAAAARVSGWSRSRVEAILEAGGVSLDGVVVTKGSHRVVGGELLEVQGELKADHVVLRPQRVAGMRIVHDDADIVVVDKPAGVAAHPSMGWDGPSVTEHLAAAGFRISTSGAPERQGVVQRLDVGTSGLMVVAKSEVAYTVLKQAFRDKTVAKTYHTLVRGFPDPHQGTIEAPIGRHPNHEWKMAVMAGGRESTTHYDTLEVHRVAALLEVNLETGRTHQIRVHMAAIGHPCVGDRLYSPDAGLAERLGLDRQWLHAVELSFTHPRGGDLVTFASAYPDDLAAALETVRNE